MVLSSLRSRDTNGSVAILLAPRSSAFGDPLFTAASPRARSSYVPAIHSLFLSFCALPCTRWVLGQVSRLLRAPRAGRQRSRTADGRMATGELRPAAKEKGKIESPRIRFPGPTQSIGAPSGHPVRGGSHSDIAVTSPGRRHLGRTPPCLPPSLASLFQPVCP